MAVAPLPDNVVVTKLDAVQEDSVILRLTALARRRGLPVLEISAVSGEGVQALVNAVGRKLEEIGRSPDEVTPLATGTPP